MTVEAATKILEDLSLKDEVADSNGQKEKTPYAKRKRPWAPRSIPRTVPVGKDLSKKRSQRRRNDSEMSVRQHRRNARNRTTSEVSTMSESVKDILPTKKLNDTILEKYEKKGTNLFGSYLKNRRELVNFESKANFLQRCKAVEVVPKPYRLTNTKIKNTKVIRRILDKYSLQLMLADFNHSRKRCDQIKKLLEERVEQMKALFDEELANTIFTTTDEAFKRRAQQLHEKDRETFRHLVEEYDLPEEHIKFGEERLKIFEQLDKERNERRLQKQQEKETNPEGKTEEATETEAETVKEA